MARGEEIRAKLQEIENIKTRESAQIGIARDVILAQADDLWDAFVAYLVIEIESIGAGLKALHVGHTLTVHTLQLPILRLTIVYKPQQSISASLFEQFTALGIPREATIRPYRLTFDPRLGACWTDGERFLSPQQVGDEFLDWIEEFFETAKTRPAILS